MPKDKDPNTPSQERKSHPPHSSPLINSNPEVNTENAAARSSPDSNNLNTIDETPTTTTTPSPSILTVEHAAAAKIYLETYFNQLLASGPSPRHIRQQLLETDLFHRARERGTPLVSTEVYVARAQFYRRESDSLREMRVMKARNMRVLRSRGPGGKKEEREGDLVNGYVTIKGLGKGSFGVVKLVRESRSRRVYAMKVIRKSKMLRSSQEGHLRAERDILVASEGSRW